MQRASINHSSGIIEAFFPSRSDISSLAVGDQAPDCFGRMARVTDIFASGVDCNGRLFVCYYAESASGLVCSNSLKQDTLLRSVELSGRVTSAEIDAAEAGFQRAAAAHAEEIKAFHLRLDAQLTEALHGGR